MDLLNSRTRPDLSTFTDIQLLDIIKCIYPDYNTDFDSISRIELVKKILELWENAPISIDAECPICLDVITNSNNMITNCGHSFHSSCMFKYIINIKNNSTIINSIKCPKCRHLIYSNLSNDLNSSDSSDSTNSLDSSDSTDTFISQNITGNIINVTTTQPGSNIFLNQDTSSVPLHNSSNLFEDLSFPINLYTGMWTSTDLLCPFPNNIVNLTNINNLNNLSDFSNVIIDDNDFSNNIFNSLDTSQYVNILGGNPFNQIVNISGNIFINNDNNDNTNHNNDNNDDNTSISSILTIDSVVNSDSQSNPV